MVGACMTKAHKKTVRSSLAVAAAFAALSIMAPAPAQAQCENPGTATAAINALVVADNLHIGQYLTQELNFTNHDLQQTATTEVLDRFKQFNDNILGWLNDWWGARLLPAMKDMSKQLGTSEIDQSRAVGAMVDAQIQSETTAQVQGMAIDAQRETTPSETACQIDTLGVGQSKGYRVARAAAGAIAREATGATVSNRQGSSGARGRGAQMSVMYDDYKTEFCDPASGDQGCAAAGTMAGMNNDLPALLWGEKQTIDLSSPSGKKAVEAATRNIAGPFADEPLPKAAEGSYQVNEAILQRRAKAARMNTIYNTLGQMVGERIGGTGVNTQDIRGAAGTQATNASTDASYREIAEAATRARFSDPEYLFRMVNYPATVVREQGAVNALRLQQLSDLFKRTEEMMWIESAVLGTMLDARVPGRAVGSQRVR